MPAGSARKPFQVDGAQAYSPDLTLVAHCDHHRKLVVDVDDLVALGAEPGSDVGATQVDQGDLVQSEAQEIVLQAGTELFGPLRKLYGDLSMVRIGSDLGGDHDPAA